jgi:serine/threonine protein kinase
MRTDADMSAEPPRGVLRWSRRARHRPVVARGSGPAPDEMVDDRYRLLDVIGAGAMGRVWRAEQPGLDRIVALKQIPLEVDGGEPAQRLRERTLREARNISVLDGAEHVVDIIDYFEYRGCVWLALEYVDSLNLAELIAVAGGRLPPGEVAWIGARIARALAAGHDAVEPILHRDVKPGNVLVGRDGTTVRLADYGISRRETDPTLTELGSVPATLPYAAPEIVRDQVLTPASDMWSLGATLFHAVEGTPPFGDLESRPALVEAVRRGIPVPNRHAGPHLEPILHRMLLPTPHGRIAAEAAAAKLEQIATPLSGRTRELLRHHRPERRTELVVDPRQPLPAGPGRPRFGKRWRITAIAVLAAGILAAFLLVPLPPAGPTTPAPSPTPPADPLAAPLPDIPSTVNYIGLNGHTSDVDPCQLLNVKALEPSGYRSTAPGPTYGACQANMSVGPDVVRLSISISTAKIDYLDPPRRAPALLGGLDVYSPKPSDAPTGSCSNHLSLSGIVQVVVTAAYLYVTASGEPEQLCPITDIATVAVIRTLSTVGYVPFNPGRPPQLALNGIDACDLLDPGTRQTGARGLANWWCSAGGPEDAITISFQFVDPVEGPARIGPYPARSGNQGSGRAGYSACGLVIQVRKRSVLDADLAESVYITAEGKTSLYQQCERVDALARFAANRLPPPS